MQEYIPTDISDLLQEDEARFFGRGVTQGIPRISRQSSFDISGATRYTLSRKGNIPMSIVVAVLSKNGIAISSDSKNSRINPKDGSAFEDTKHGSIQKIFQNKNLIAASWDGNEIFRPDGNVIRMDKFLQESIEKDINGSELLHLIQTELKESKIPEKFSNISYRFLIGSHSDFGCGYQINEYLWKNGNLSHPAEYNTPQLIWGGTQIAAPEFFLYDSDKDYSVKEMSDLTQKFVEYAIQDREILLNLGLVSYSPVGGKIQTKIFV